MRPTTAENTAHAENVFHLDALFHPAARFSHPLDVVRHKGMSIAEKRAILASWASDASAVASCPSLRAPQELKRPVTVSEILDALCELDDGPHFPPGGKSMRRQSAFRAAA